MSSLTIGSESFKKIKKIDIKYFNSEVSEFQKNPKIYDRPDTRWITNILHANV